MVGEFHKACDIDSYSPNNLPHWPVDETINLRVSLIEEELKEFKEAIAATDMVAAADALSDLLYVVYGSGHAFNLNLDKTFEEVHRSNMTKCVNGHGIRREDGKILKPESYEPPNLAGVIYK